MDSKLKQWRDDQKRLPEFMRDFHNCKQLFKGIADYIELEDDHPAKEVNWRQAHCYTITSTAVVILTASPCPA